MAQGVAITPSYDQTHQSSSDGEILDVELLVKTLDRKRHQLDKQIEQFRALKDQEFRAFEYWLRHRARKSDLLKEDERLRSNQKQTFKNGTDLGQHNRQDKSPNNPSPPAMPMNGLEGLEPVWPPESIEANGEELNPLFTKAFYGSRGFDEMLYDEHGRSENHRREKEFQGVFTPDYLSLLAAGGRDAQIGNAGLSTAGQASKDQEQPPTSPFQRHDASNGLESSALLSSSAESHRPAPLTAQALSSSCPDSHDPSSHHRRTSSAGRSDTSIASLRSSFKDPKTPRSPKRVMFDIDDMVVSPSTSPLLEKNKTGNGSGNEKAKKSKIEDGEKFEIVKKKKHGTKRHGPKSKTSEKDKGKQSESLLRSSLTANGGTKASDNAPTQLTSFVDDFEKVTFNDDMFAFDEDLNMDDESGAKSKENEAIAETDADKDAEGAQAPLTGSSPHAGSLPIEIRWPSRRGDVG